MSDAAPPAPPAAPAADAPKKRGRPKDSKNHDPKRRKTKAEPKPKPPAKVDVDKQCGVPLVNQEGEPTGALCARSLTCKTHSMGAKRAVKGRSQPYDTLLSAYQQRNHLKAAAATAQQQHRRAAAEVDALEGAGEPPLSDADEVAAVYRGVLQATPIPLDRAVLTPTRLRTDYINLRELLYKSVSTLPPPPPASIASRLPLAAVIASTDAVLGRCILFNPRTGAQNIRPSQIHGFARMQRLVQERFREHK